MRKKIAAGNWKMNLQLDEALELIKSINILQTKDFKEIILGVPAIYLRDATSLVSQNDHVKIAAQNCHEKLSGAFTGELSASMLKSVDVDYVILGHSERRQYFNESDDVILQKIESCFDQGLKVIYCCGEPLEVREAGREKEYVTNQITSSILTLDVNKIKNVIVAYEPIWAIGTGMTATSDQAQEMHEYIRSVIMNNFGAAIADDISILYGGSVKPANASELFKCPDVDGGLIGGASLKFDSFSEIYQCL